MTSNGLVSVIVPTYNAEKYLDECIQSIVRQTYENIEILLVNDGSTDGSNDICKEWEHRDKRIKTIIQRNGGVSKARNTGINNAKGSLLMMVDSDDYISSDMIEVLYEGYTQNDADVVICDFEQGENRNHPFSNDSASFKQIDFETVMNKAYSSEHDALRFVAPWGKLYKKELFNNIQYPEGKIFEDIYITHRLLFKAEKIITTDQKLLYYFNHDDSIMRKPFHLGKLDYLDALLDRIDFFKEKGLKKLEETAYEEYLHSLIWEYSRVRDILHDGNAKEEIRKRFRNVYKEGYSCKKYPHETSMFLKAFCVNPELIVLYWRASAILKRIRGMRQ